MKKSYIIPLMKQEQAEAEQMLAVSGIGNDGYGIGYGGVDRGGNLDPSAKQITDVKVWDKEW